MLPRPTALQCHLCIVYCRALVATITTRTGLSRSMSDRGVLGLTPRVPCQSVVYSDHSCSCFLWVFFFTQGDGTRSCNGRHFITTFFLPCRPCQWKHLFGPWPLSHASSVGAVIGESVARKKKEHCKSGTSESPYLGSLNPTRHTNAVDGRLAQKATS